jgi:hypothetical protein
VHGRGCDHVDAAVGIVVIGIAVILRFQACNPSGKNEQSSLLVLDVIKLWRHKKPDPLSIRGLQSSVAEVFVKALINQRPV